MPPAAPQGQPPPTLHEGVDLSVESGARANGSRPGGGHVRAGNLAGRTLAGAIWVLSWPILVESLLNSFVGLTDTILSAGLDDGGAATDAIGGAAYFLWFIGLVVAAVGVGATALISRAVGAGRLAVANAALGQTMLLAILSGAVTGLVIVGITWPAPVLLNMNEDATRAFRLYMSVNAAGVPFMAIVFAGIACLRGAGDALRPLWAMVAVNGVNVVVSWTLAGVDWKTTRFVGGEAVTTTILHNPFAFDLGIAGIAMGTVIAHLVGSIVIIGMLLRGSGGVRLIARRLRPHRHTLLRLVRIGWPNFLETFGMWAGNFLVLLMVGWMAIEGGGLLGAHIIAIRIEAFSFLPGFSMGLASATLVGQYLGAGNPGRAARAVWVCTAVGSVVMGVMGLLFIAAPRQIVGLLSSQDVHLELAPQLLVITGLVQIPFAVSIVLRSALRGAGDVRAAMWLTWITTYGLRIPLAYIFSGVEIPLPGGTRIPNPFPFDGGLPGLWIGLCIEIVLRAILFGARFGSGAWARARV